MGEFWDFDFDFAFLFVLNSISDQLIHIKPTAKYFSNFLTNQYKIFF